MTRKQQDAIAEQRKKLVDEYGQISARLAPFKADIARLADIAKSIRSWSDDAPANNELRFAGADFICTLGPREMQSRIPDMLAVYQALGRDTFLGHCSMTLKALQSAGGDAAALTVKEQTGSRSLNVQRIAATAHQAA